VPVDERPRAFDRAPTTRDRSLLPFLLCDLCDSVALCGARTERGEWRQAWEKRRMLMFISSPRPIIVVSTDEPP
jgi:hypothetical protein